MKFVAAPKAWWMKFGAIVTVGVTAALAMQLTGGQWALATDVQKYYRCLPFDWYVVTDMEQAFMPTRGELVRFTAPDYVERFTEQFEIIKIVAAVAGDSWRIDQDELYVNDEWWGAMHLMAAIGAAPQSLDGEGVVPDGHVFVLGTNPSSYDSRYWGPLSVENITGKAHVVF